MHMRLEEGLAARVKVPKGKRDLLIFDTVQTGLFLRVFASGKATYGVRYEVAGKQRQKHIREVISGVKGLAAARKEAADVRAKARLGTDVVAEVNAAKAAAGDKGNTLGKLATQFLAARRADWRPRYYEDAERYLTKHWKPLHDTPIKVIRWQDVVRVLDDIADKRGRFAADRALAAMSAFYSWALDKDHCDAAPVLRIKSRSGNSARDRTLSPQELAEVWRAADARGEDDYGRIVKLLILTGQRREEVGSLAWAEVVENGGGIRLELPGARTKNHLPHIVPLNALALAQVPARPDRDDPAARTMVFGRRAHTGFTGWSKAKAELDEATAAARERKGIKEPMPAWRLHDLRRTFVTLVGEQGFAPPHVIEAIVNHVSGHKAGVAGVYNKAVYWEERCKALDAWGRYVEGQVRA